MSRGPLRIACAEPVALEQRHSHAFLGQQVRRGDVGVAAEVAEAVSAERDDERRPARRARRRRRRTLGLGGSSHAVTASSHWSTTSTDGQSVAGRQHIERPGPRREDPHPSARRAGASRDPGPDERRLPAAGRTDDHEHPVGSRAGQGPRRSPGRAAGEAVDVLDGVGEEAGPRAASSTTAGDRPMSRHRWLRIGCLELDDAGPR